MKVDGRAQAETQKMTTRRVGMVIGLRAECLDAYQNLHATSHPGVRDLLSKYHIRSFSIFEHQLPDGQHYLFGFYEYMGSDFDSDMKSLASEPRNKEWLSLTDPMQIPLPGEESWAQMQEVYFNL